MENGGEYKAKKMIRYLIEQDIQHHIAVPYTQQQNGIIENKYCFITELIRCLLLVGLPGLPGGSAACLPPPWLGLYHLALSCASGWAVNKQSTPGLKQGTGFIDSLSQLTLPFPPPFIPPPPPLRVPCHPPLVCVS